jgi:hypothetical protein
VVPSDDFYGETIEEDVKQISNLEEGAEDDILEEKMINIKIEELQKWN